MADEKKSSLMYKACGAINSMQTLTNSYPQLNTAASMLLGETGEISCSFDLLFKLLEQFGVTKEDLIEMVSSWLCGNENTGGILEALEQAVKLILLTNVKNLFTCSVNPILDDKLMYEYDYLGAHIKGSGLEINLDNMDMNGMLKYSPISTTGKYFYFDTYESLNDAWKSCDFNAFLWHVINKETNVEAVAKREQVWDNRVRYIKSIMAEGGHEKWADFFTLIPTEENEGKVKIEGVEAVTKKQFIRCAFYEHSSKMATNILKVWLNPDRYYKQRTIKTANHIITYTYTSAGTKYSVDRKSEIPDAYSGTCLYTARTKDDVTKYTYVSGGTEYTVDSEDEIPSSIKSKKGYVKNIRNGELKINKTIFEFNYDYIYSLKLFEKKTMIAYLINAMFGLIDDSIGLTKYSVTEKIIEGKVGSYVKNIIKQDDENYTSDCFFTFSNEEYDKLLTEANLLYNGQYQSHNEINSLINVDTADLLSKLDSISDSATIVEQQETISNILTEITATLATDDSIDSNSTFTFGLQVIMELIKGFVVQVCMQLLSPKVAILYGINCAIMGNWEETDDNPKFNNWEDFITNIQNLIVTIIQNVKEILLQWLYEYLMKRLTQVLVIYAAKLAIESIEDYKKILETLATCYPNFSNDTSLVNHIDNVTYADIVPTQTTPKTDNC